MWARGRLVHILPQVWQANLALLETLFVETVVVAVDDMTVGTIVGTGSNREGVGSVSGRVKVTFVLDEVT